MKSFLALLFTVGTLFLSGCTGPAAAPEAQEPPVVPAVVPPTAVIALVDTGINPYHVDFRDDSPRAFQHPSTYLPGYPADAIALNLTLNGDDLEKALKADKKAWDSVKPGKLYWFPGTKVVGAIGPDGLFSTGHGTMTASRAAGNKYSLCGECLIVSVQGFTAKSVQWASEQPWIDAQSNSWSPAVTMQQADPAQSPGLADAFEAAAQRHLVFASAGNGAVGKFGVLGHPSFTRSTSGPPGVVAVGGHDNGQVILWSGSWPHVSADACDNWAAVGDTVDGYGPREGGGTSSASPYAAGEAAALILEARRLLGDDRSAGVTEGILARGVAVEGSPILSDGQLSIGEVKDILMKTAVARPLQTEHDGELCPPEMTPYTTYPIQWKDLPADLPTYYFIGYGQISVDSAAAAMDVLKGATELPARPVEDQWHAYAQSARDAYNGLP